MVSRFGRSDDRAQGVGRRRKTKEVARRLKRRRAADGKDHDSDGDFTGVMRAVDLRWDREAQNLSTALATLAAINRR